MARTKLVTKSITHKKSGNKFPASNTKSIKSIKTKTSKAPLHQLSSSPSIRKAHRFRPGTVALREIRKQQKSVDFCLRLAPFQRLVKEIMADFKMERTTKGCKEALQVVAEDFVIHYLQAGNVITVAGNRSTITVKDLNTANDVVLVFPGKAIDHSFKERIHVAPSARPTPKAKKTEKKKKSVVPKDVEASSSSSSPSESSDSFSSSSEDEQTPTNGPDASATAF